MLFTSHPQPASPSTSSNLSKPVLPPGPCPSNVTAGEWRCVFVWRVAKVHESPRLCVDASGSVIALVISRFCHLEFLQLFVWLPSNARWVQVASCNINSKGQYPCLWGTGVLIWLIISHGSAQVPWHIRPRLVKKNKNERQNVHHA